MVSRWVSACLEPGGANPEDEQDDWSTCATFRSRWWPSDRLTTVTPGMRAAIEVAAQLGLHVDDPVLIQETNHTVVWLPSSDPRQGGDSIRQCRGLES